MSQSPISPIEEQDNRPSWESLIHYQGGIGKMQIIAFIIINL